MSATIEMTGLTFGRLTVTARSPRPGKQMHWLCRCVCGEERTVAGGDLRSGHTASCGCSLDKHGATAGGVRTPEYEVWKAMRRRCESPRDKAFKHYGGRGITVCERWLTFSNFIADMGTRPSAKHQIERADNDQGYAPSNCTWATKIEQMANTRRTRRFHVSGEVITARQYADREGVPYSTARSRLERLTISEEA